MIDMQYHIFEEISQSQCHGNTAVSC